MLVGYAVATQTWTNCLSPGTLKIGFLVDNYVYSLIPRSKLANPGQASQSLSFNECIFINGLIGLMNSNI